MTLLFKYKVHFTYSKVLLLRGRSTDFRELIQTLLAKIKHISGKSQVKEVKNDISPSDENSLHGQISSSHISLTHLNQICAAKNFVKSQVKVMLMVL